MFLGTVFELDESGLDTFLLAGHNFDLLGSPDHAGDFLARLGELAYHNYNRSRGRPPGQTRLRVRYRRTATEWFDYWFMAPSELDSLAAEEGWAVVEQRALVEGSYLAVLEMKGGSPASRS